MPCLLSHLHTIMEVQSIAQYPEANSIFSRSISISIVPSSLLILFLGYTFQVQEYGRLTFQDMTDLG